MEFFTTHGFASSRSILYLVCGYWVVFSDLSLSLASQNLPANPSYLHANPSLKTEVRRRKKLLIGLSISALFLSWVLFMACFKFIRLRIRRVRRTNKQQDEEKEMPQTQIPDSQSELDSIGSIKNTVKRFKWEEIEKLTKNFSCIIGEGGFSTAYQVYFPDSSLGALKIHRNSERLHRVFKQELEVLLLVRHENIVKLIGFCDEGEAGALVFEYISNGDLHERLHGGGEKILSWDRRMFIAFQLANAIEYLHDCCNLQIVHADIKSSNVLLDENLNCKLCDFGSAKMGFSSMILPISATPMMGSPGYVDPHYIRTGMVSKKSDIYSFGVLILELITGIEAFCSEKEQLLTSLAEPALRDSNKITDMIDSRLAGNFDQEEARIMASVSTLCILEQPSLRPSMNDILTIMREKISSIFSGKFKENSKEEHL